MTVRDSDMLNADVVRVANSSGFSVLNSTAHNIGVLDVDDSSVFVQGSASINSVESENSDLLFIGAVAIKSLDAQGGRIQGGPQVGSLNAVGTSVYLSFQEPPATTTLVNCTGDVSPGNSNKTTNVVVSGGSLSISRPASGVQVVVTDGATVYPQGAGSVGVEASFLVSKNGGLSFKTGPMLAGSVTYTDGTGFWELYSSGPLLSAPLVLNNTLVRYQAAPGQRILVVKADSRTGEFNPVIDWPLSDNYGGSYIGQLRYTDGKVLLDLTKETEAPQLPVVPPIHPQAPATLHVPVESAFSSVTWILSSVAVGASTILIFIIIFTLKVCRKNNGPEDESTSWLTEDLASHQ